MPAFNPAIVVLVPVPVVMTLSGYLVNSQAPEAGSPERITLPVGTAQVGWIMAPGIGGAGTGLTVSVYTASAASQGSPSGLFVVIVIITVLPISDAAGTYAKSNGVVFVETGMTVPPPFSEIVTPVALPLNLLPVTVIIAVPQVLPVMLLRVRAGGFAQPHDISKEGPVVEHPDEFLTVTV